MKKYLSLMVTISQTKTFFYLTKSISENALEDLIDKYQQMRASNLTIENNKH